MTKAELKNLGVGTESLDEELKKLNIAVEAAAGAYATAGMASEPKLTAIRKGTHSVHKQIESPVGYLRMFPLIRTRRILRRMCLGLRQLSSHSIEGPLVLSVSCPHKNASIVAPFLLHVDKAMKVWNHLFPVNKEKFSIISGVTYGSSFVGMVHVLNTKSSSASESMEATASQMQSTMNVGAWFAMGGQSWRRLQLSQQREELLSQ
ncbi:hypothetical protein FCIRC_9900 [Fusarium circinatum]|uniref:Uncharacterized protein n=1 Tax=Fusarium circinatum TaxID=48490 RepID=A0A8H5WRB4_FUSCI|nr:hypothetical protein FCIRC_9900 [Fusarium circinatum]